MRLAATIALVLGLAGCGDGAMDARTCATRAHALATYLQDMDHDASLLPPGSMVLAVRDDLPAAQPAFAPIVMIGEDHLGVQGQRLGADDVDAVAERLEATLRRVREDAALGRRGAEPDTLLVAIDAAAPWARVEAVLAAAARAGANRFELAFGRTPRPQAPPPPSKIDRELDAIFAADGSDRATRFAEVAKRQVNRCGALARAFGAVADPGPGEDRAELLIRSLEPALVECGCRADLPSLQALFYRLLYNPNPVGWLSVSLGAGEPLVAAPDARWRDVAPRLQPGATLALPPR